MTIINSVREYIENMCPYLDDNGRVNINYLADRAVEYSIEEVPAGAVVRRYADGGMLKQFLFVFASREFYGEDVLENIRASAFYELFLNWVAEQNRIGNLPVLGEGRVPQKLECLTGGYLFDNEISSARYQIQMRLIYMQNHSD